MSRTFALSALCIAAAAAGPAALAQDASVSVTDLKLGDHWYGPEYSSSDLKGRVVLFEVWGLQ